MRFRIPFGLSLSKPFNPLTSSEQAPRTAMPGAAGRAVLPPHAVVRRRVAQGWADQGSRLSERSEFERDPAQTEQRSEPSRSDGDGAPAKARH